MSEFRNLLGRGVGDYDPQPDEGLEHTLDRARRRHRRRQVLAGTLAFGLFGATLAGAVALRDSEGRPVAGPTASPSPYGTEQAGKKYCDDPPRRGPFCLVPTTPVVTVASGRAAGVGYSFRAWGATYVGDLLDPKESGVREVEVPVLCHQWSFGTRRKPRCGTDAWSISLEKAGGSGGRGGFYESSAFDEIRGSGGGFTTDTVGSTTAVWAWTPESTSTVTVVASGSETSHGRVAGPFPELGRSLKWFVAFMPIRTPTISMTAYGPDEQVLWSERDRRILPFERVDVFPTSTSSA